MKGRALQSDAAKFDYGVMDGYRKWGGICQKGDSIPQSPINIPAKTASAALRAPTGVHSPLALAAHFVLNLESYTNEHQSWSRMRLQFSLAKSIQG